MHIFNKFPALVSRICHSPGMPVCSGDLPETDFNFCHPDIRLSEIQRVFLALPQSAEFDDWFNPVSWNARLSQDSTDHNAIRTLTCIGDKPAPNSTRKVISGGRKKTTQKTHTLFITIDEVSDLNHAFVQKLKNGKKFRMWYEIAGGFMFGGAGGILVTVYGDMVLLRGKDEIITYELQIVWDSLRTEDRIESPIFEPPGGGGEEETPLAMRVLIYPHCLAAPDGTDPASSSGFWKFHIKESPRFINLNALNNAYSIPTNTLHYDIEETYFAGGGGMTTSDSIGVPPQTLKLLHWWIPYVPTAAGMIVYCPLPDNTITFDDILGNVAWCVPTVLLNKNANLIRHFLLPECDATLLSSTGSIATVRLWRKHPNISDPNITFSLGWDIPGGLVTMPDPSDPTHPDKIVVEFPPGVYTIGVEAFYDYSLAAIDYPKSRIYFVLEAY